MFLFDIVNNQKCGLDLDRLDYVNRDLLHTKINLSSINYKRILTNARIVENQLAFNKKILSDALMLF
jgi:HD superfamily phosphohydrolase